MKNNGFLRIWGILYPVFMYYAVSNIVIALAVMALNITEDNYVQSYTMLQTIAVAVAIPMLYGFYRKDQQLFTVYHQRTRNEKEEAGKENMLWTGVCIFLCGALVGLVLNQIFEATGLTEMSEGYRNVTSHFFSGDLLFEILGLGILAPVAEEILYRGVVYARMSGWMGLRMAAVSSALVFGGLHMNLVQFAYAFLMGLLLVFFLEKCHNLWGAVLGHIGANLITVLRVETGMLDWMEKNQVLYWGVTALMAAACLLLLWFLSGNTPWGKSRGQV